MSEPEIARRCQSCGAAIRDLAFFCPQCGKSLKNTGDLSKTAPDQEKQSSAVATSPLEAPIEKEQFGPGGSGGKKPVAEGQKTQNPSGPSKGTPGAPGLAGGRGKVQRATGLARNVGGDVIQRGQKLREMSGVVLDEASYDPSLRFVLIAAALFLLFLVIVVLNRFIV